MLDVAGGTGDIGFRILEKARTDNPHHRRSELRETVVDVTISDINADMLEVGKRRSVEAGTYHEL